MIKLLLWLLLGRKLAEPFLTIVEPRRRAPRRYPTVMLRRALWRCPGVGDLPYLPVPPHRHAPPHKNEGPPNAITIHRPQFGPVRPGRPPFITGILPYEDTDDKACGDVDKILKAHHDLRRFGDYSCEQDWD